MAHRRTIPMGGNRAVALVTEQMDGGVWRVVVSVIESTGGGERVTDLPVSRTSFDTEAAAEAYGLRLAQDWIADNTPARA